MERGNPNRIPIPDSDFAKGKSDFCWESGTNANANANISCANANLNAKIDMDVNININAAAPSLILWLSADQRRSALSHRLCRTFFHMGCVLYIRSDGVLCAAMKSSAAGAERACGGIRSW